MLERLPLHITRRHDEKRSDKNSIKTATDGQRIFFTRFNKIFSATERVISRETKQLAELSTYNDTAVYEMRIRVRSKDWQWLIINLYHERLTEDERVISYSKDVLYNTKLNAIVDVGHNYNDVLSVADTENREVFRESEKLTGPYILYYKRQGAGSTLSRFQTNWLNTTKEIGDYAIKRLTLKQLGTESVIAAVIKVNKK
ncbi:MAG: hypothetical protein OEY36_03810 [Gammaproteobacteria bacterium]|nr:hypothetical protein [Gammaproteobacteria bacterium]